MTKEIRPSILQITTSASQTSGPFNQYTLGRIRDRPGERSIYVGFFSSTDGIEKKLRSYGVGNRITLVSAEGNPVRFLSLVSQHAQDLSRFKRRAVVHVHAPILAGPLLILKPFVFSGLPTLYTIQNDFKKYSSRNKLLSAIAFLLAGHITFVSHDAANKYPDSLKRMRMGEWEVVPNGVDTKRVDRVLDRQLQSSSSISGANQKRLDLITIGRMIHQKKQKFLIDVLAELDSDTHLTIIGKGPLKEKLRERAEQRGVADRLHFTGLLPRDKVFMRLAEADIFVSAAHWEGLPVAVMEAMAVRLPVVLSDIPPHRELLVDDEGERGPLVLPEKIQKWTREIKNLTNEEREARGRVCRQIVEENFSLQQMHDGYDEVYSELLNGT